MNIIEYFKNNPKLFIVTVAAIAAVLIAIILIVVIRCVVRKSAKTNCEPTTPETGDAPQSEPVDEKPETEDAVTVETDDAEELPAEEKEEEEAVTVEVNEAEELPAEEKEEPQAKQPSEKSEEEQEKAQTKKAETTVKKATAKKATKKASPKKDAKPTEKKPAAKKVDEEQTPTRYSGKWIIEKENDRFYAKLTASNGEVLLRTESYTALSGIKSGIETVKNNILKNNFAISVDKYDNYFFKIYSSSTRLLCVSEGYSTKAACESAIESVKRFAKTAVIVKKQDEVKIEEKPTEQN